MSVIFNNKWWKKYSTYVYIFAIIFTLIIIGIIMYNTDFETTNSFNNIKINQDDYIFNYKKHYKLPSKKDSKGEIICKQVAENLFNKPFIKIRPNWLKNHKTGSNLELDVYNDELKLAIEYSGIQHYKYTPHFHKNQQAFEDQKFRDQLKEQKCKEHGIKLIVVPYLIKHNEIERFIKLKAKDLGLI